MTTKLEKLLAQVAEEKARIAAQKKAEDTARIKAISALVIKAGIAGLPVNFLEQQFAKIAAAVGQKEGVSNE